MPALFTGLITMVTAQLLDLGTFVTMIRRLGPRAEANPFVADILADHGLPLLVLGKVLVMLFVAALAVVLAHRASPSDRRVAALVLGVSIAAGIIGGGSNALVIGPL